MNAHTPDCLVAWCTMLVSMRNSEHLRIFSWQRSFCSEQNCIQKAIKNKVYMQSLSLNLSWRLPCSVYVRVYRQSGGIPAGTYLSSVLSVLETRTKDCCKQYQYKPKGFCKQICSTMARLTRKLAKASHSIRRKLILLLGRCDRPHIG